MARARRSNARYGKRPTTGPTLDPEGLLAGSKIEVVHGIVAEPNPTLISVAVSHRKSAYVRAAINAKADVLEWEYRYRRISPIAYAAGNTYLGIMGETYSAELCALPLEPSPHVSDDGTKAILRMERAMRVNAMRQDVVKALGKDAVAIIDDVLGGGETERAHRSLTQVAADGGITSNRHVRKFCQDFRKALEDLALHWGGTSWPRVTG
jgi:hypothetical protein